MVQPKGTALVTGGAVRVGKAIVHALAAAGYDIALHYNHSEQDATETAATIHALGRKCTLFHADLGDSKQYIPLIEKVFSAHPDCNVLVNNASIFERCDFMGTTEDIFDRHMGINFKAPFFLTQTFARCTDKGVIINLLDTYVTRTTGTYFAYLLSKKALQDLTLMAARDLGPGIRVNGICPGTLLPSPAHPTQADVDAKAAVMPLARASTLKDVTDTLMFLVESPFLTGECIFVDSGQKVA